MTAVTQADDRPAATVLVAGAAGYLGSILTRQLLERGHRVRAFDSFLFGDHGLEEIAGHARLEIVRGDIRDLAGVFRALVGVDAVVMLAALVGEAACDRDPRETLAVNYVAPLAVAEACARLGIERYVFASTDSAYGIREGIMYEDSPCNPISLYARLKEDVEKKLLALAGPDFTPCVLRQGTLYGLSPRMRFDLIINVLTLHAVTKGRFTIYGGKQWRPLVHVSDAARAFVMALEAPAALVKGEIFNVGSNAQNYQIFQIGDIVAELIPEASRETTDVPPDLRDYNVSFDKIARTLGFEVRHQIADAVQEIRQALESGAIAEPHHARYRNA